MSGVLEIFVCIGNDLTGSSSILQKLVERTSDGASVKYILSNMFPAADLKLLGAFGVIGWLSTSTLVLEG